MQCVLAVNGVNVSCQKNRANKLQKCGKPVFTTGSRVVLPTSGLKVLELPLISVV